MSKKAISAGFILLLVPVTACTNKTVHYQSGENTMPARTIKEVLEQHTKELMSLPGVTGTGEGLCDGIPCIKVYVIKRTPEIDREIPDTLDGYKVMIEVTGRIRAHPAKPERTIND